MKSVSGMVQERMKQGGSPEDIAKGLQSQMPQAQ
jgi:hypothetical protein